MLTEKVKLQAKRATIKIAHKALTLPQMVELYALTRSLQAPLSSVKAAKAKDKFADSKMIKKRSRRTSRILAFGDRRPSGFPVYSSQVM
jgi:hypothetical protein